MIDCNLASPRFLRNSFYNNFLLIQDLGKNMLPFHNYYHQSYRYSKELQYPNICLEALTQLQMEYRILCILFFPNYFFRHYSSSNRCSIFLDYWIHHQRHIFFPLYSRALGLDLSIDSGLIFYHFLFFKLNFSHDDKHLVYFLRNPPITYT